MVREVGVIWAGAEEVKGDGEVKREHADGHVPAIQHGGHAAVQEDTGEVGREGGGRCKLVSCKVMARETQLIFFIRVPGTYSANG